jgi:hypothetical protein
MPLFPSIAIMRFRLYIPPALLLMTLLLLAGCGDNAAQFVSIGVPRGTWVYSRLDTQGGEERRHTRTLTLDDTLGTLDDTLLTRRSSVSWSIDSVSRTTMSFQSIGDGYQRTVEIRSGGSTLPDTSIRYYYFFKRGDSLSYYAGMRFVGSGARLLDTWKSDERDTLLLGESIGLSFRSDSVSVTRRPMLHAGSDTVLPYRTKGDTLTIDGFTTFGDRYEVIPGWSLYITTHASPGYARKL